MQTESIPSEPAQIASGLRSRDPRIVEELIERHQSRVLNYLRGLTRNRDDAEDLSQETWLRVLERGSQYRGEWTFESWLLAISRNLVIDEVRKASIRPSLSLEQVSDRCRLVASSAPSPFDLACRRERAGRLRSTARRLAPRLRAVWQLRFERNLPLEDIARRLNLRPGTVRSRLHRSMAAVRRGLKCQPR